MLRQFLCRISPSSTVAGRFITSSSTSSSPSILNVQKQQQIPAGSFCGLFQQRSQLSHLSSKSSCGSLLSIDKHYCHEGGQVLLSNASTTSCPGSSVFGGICVVPQRGMKIKGRVKRRCKDCYLEYVDGILHVFCKTHPRHKQMLKPRYFANSRILTHATSHFKPSWI